VSTDQDGNFRVGEYFKIDQATGTATLNANAFNLAGLTSLRLGSIGAQLGETINEFSSDETLGGNSNTAVPTEYAVKTYVDIAVNGAIFTGEFDNANSTYDANGNLTSATQGDLQYSNITWQLTGLDLAQYGLTVDTGSYYRLVSWTETSVSTGTAQNITIAYNSSTNLIDTITIS